MKDLPTDKLVFIDEAAISTAMNLGYAWSPVGERAVVLAPTRGVKLTLMAGIALDGVRAEASIQGSMNGDKFQTFLRDVLGPTLHRGDVVVMDNLSSHKMVEVAALLNDFGATPLYLPAYSPEFNPIEMCWSFLKHSIRRAAPRAIDRLLQKLQSAWNQVTSELCGAWVKHCGYAVHST